MNAFGTSWHGIWQGRSRAPVGRRVPVAVAASVAVLGLVVACATPAPSAGKAAGSAAASPASPGASGSGGGIRPGTAFTAVFTSTLTTPAPVRATDGKVHLAYELLVTNATALPVRIDDVEVRDGRTHRPLLTLTGAALRAALTTAAGSAGDEETIDPSRPGSVILASSATWVVWLDIALTRLSAVPAQLEHRAVGVIVVPGGASPLPFDSLVGKVDTSRRAATVLSPPVPGGIWYMSEGCCTDDTHHRRGLAPINGQLSVPQRFAIDFFRLDAQHRTWIGDPSKVASYLSYQQPVIASAPGTIVASLDGLPNSTALPNPPKPPPIEQTVGNDVIEQIGPGLYILYAHLDPGSVKVHVGQQVRRGQLLGLIGTSGNSTTPHLHFQILTTPTFFPSDSVPYVFDKFTLPGRITERLWDDNLGLQPTGALPFEAASPVTQRRNEMPLDRSVVQFPARH
jgi:hypothetical protein